MAVGFILSGIAGLAGFASLLTIAMKKVREGRGFETFRTFWLVEFSYIGVLVLFAFAFGVLLFGVVLWWREEREWRALERKYEARGEE